MQKRTEQLKTQTEGTDRIWSVREQSGKRAGSQSQVDKGASEKGFVGITAAKSGAV